MPFPSPQQPKLLDRVRIACRVRRFSPRTEDVYAAWGERFIRFHGIRHPNAMAEPGGRSGVFRGDLLTRTGEPYTVGLMKATEVRIQPGLLRD